ncbi:MAG: DUF2520 domain-containing protein [Bacteroidaceae bacterium]|nr:DUF2520 domain-containing protein [Bacteroidaceae bacterium]
MITSIEHMDIVLVGAGNVATCMGGALKSAGHDIKCVYSRTERNAMALANKLDTCFVTDLEQLPEADAFIVMLRDDALLSLAAKIVSSHPEKLFLHTSGSVPNSLWKSAGATRYGVLYPMQTFSKGKSVEWGDVPVFIEASSDECLQKVRNIAESLSDNCTVLDSEQRSRLHLAAVFACNFSNRMYAIADELLKECGIPFSVMLPLIAETADKVSSMPPVSAQTGPAVRGDKRVMDVHRRLLTDKPEWRILYDLISKDIKKSCK